MTIPPLLISVSSIWDQGPHAAFSDLSIHFNRFFLAFREGKDHVKSGGGKIRILTSDEREPSNFRSTYLIEKEGFDLRDPKITKHPLGQLHLICAMIQVDAEGDPIHIRTAVSMGEKLADIQPVYKENFWIWRVTWFEGIGYGIAYPLRREQAPELVRTVDGFHFDKVTEFDFPITEATLRPLATQSGIQLALLGRVRQEKAVLGFATNPFLEWNFLKTGFDLHGPDLITFSTGEMLLGGRLLYSTPYGRVARCGLIEKEEMHLKRALIFPGYGDTGYPSFLFHDGFLWVSYHAGVAGKSEIFLAKVLLGHH